MDIPAAISTISTGIAAARAVAGAVAEMDKADLKLRIVGLVDDLLVAKDALIDAREQHARLESEIADLRRALQFSATLVEWQGFKYKSSENGQRIGRPFCPRCNEVDGRFVTLQETVNKAEWYLTCPECKNEFLVDKAAKQRADEARRQTAERTMRGLAERGA